MSYSRFRQNYTSQNRCNEIYAFARLVTGCAVRRAELAEFTIEDIQQREGRWVIADVTGNGGRIRTVAVPLWVRQLMDPWTAAAGHGTGRMLRPISKGGRIMGEELSDWAVWSVVEQSEKAIGIERFGAHDLRRYARNSTARTAETSNRSSTYSAMPPYKPPNATSVPSMRLPSRSTIIQGCELIKAASRVTEPKGGTHVRRVPLSDYGFLH